MGFDYISDIRKYKDSTELLKFIENTPRAKYPAHQWDDLFDYIA